MQANFQETNRDDSGESLRSGCSALNIAAGPTPLPRPPSQGELCSRARSGADHDLNMMPEENKIKAITTLEETDKSTVHPSLLFSTPDTVFAAVVCPPKSRQRA